ncbi:hypothetical protein [Microbacterium sp.]|uniref:hypothetical protein n=1 Tax=Microbacterium sp. TaxID=51671 RepID=UPI00324286EA
MTSSSFTAHIRIAKTTTAPATSGDRYGQNARPASRDVEEVADFTIRGDSVAAVTAKAAAHLQLLNPEGTNA